MSHYWFQCADVDRKQQPKQRRGTELSKTGPDSPPGCQKHNNQNALPALQLTLGLTGSFEVMFGFRLHAVVGSRYSKVREHQGHLTENFCHASSAFTTALPPGLHHELYLRLSSYTLVFGLLCVRLCLCSQGHTVGWLDHS